MALLVISPSHALSSPMPNSLKNIFIAATFLKLLLFYAYRSTDFEVHRNWLAITYNLPVNKWYLDTTSEWTLDYPPFFAYFEYLLALAAPGIVRADGALDLVSDGVYGWPTIAYQRATVVVFEVVLFASLQWYINTAGSFDGRARLRAFAIAASIVLSPGLLIIDHIHFQYNGFLYGILMLSIVAALTDRAHLSAALFAVLLMFKHIYLYLAPAYFVYLLRTCVLTSNARGIQWKSTIALGAIVISVFAIALAPFAYYHQLPQLLARLFPFSRGLTHAYWAPNVWAIYSFADRILGLVTERSVASATRGLVGDVQFAVLADIQPRLTFFLTLFYQVLTMVPLFLQPTKDRFVASITLCGYASFLFGWHVHEKAILLVIFPFSLLALKDRRILSAFVPLTVAGYISLFPLIFTSAETVIKTLYTFVWFVMFHLSFRNLVQVSNIRRRVFLLDRAVLIYMVGFVPLMISTGILPRILPRFEFLGLMAISVYCSVGIIGSWAGFSWLYFFDDELWKVDSNKIVKAA